MEDMEMVEVELEGTGERTPLSFKKCDGLKFKKFTRVDANLVLGIAEGPSLVLWHRGNFAAVIAISQKKEGGGKDGK